MTGKELQHWRKAMGYKNQQEAADALGTPLRTYQRWESAGQVDKVVELASLALSIKATWEGMRQPINDFSRLVRMGH